MAYLILTSKGRETGRRQLAGPLTIGRAPDCDLAVRDVLLSRHHCRIEPAGRGWVVVDLGSKNGTWLDGERVGRRQLRCGDVLRLGKNTIRLAAGDVADLPHRPSDATGGAGESEQDLAVPSRPADPFEAMSGTVAGAVLDVLEFEPAPGQPPRPRRPVNRFPTPQPMPREPVAYARDDIYSMLSEIASSSWDSIYANASRPTRPAARVILPEGMAKTSADRANGGSVVAARRPQTPMGSDDQGMTARRSRPRRGRVDLALQAPLERQGRPARPPFPLPLPIEPFRDRYPVLRRAVDWAAHVLTRVRMRIAPRGAVVLF